MLREHAGREPRPYKKKSVVIEAMFLDGTEETLYAVFTWIFEGSPTESKPLIDVPEGAIFIPTLEGVMMAKVNDWVIRGVKGEFYPCKNDIFEESYDRIGSYYKSGEISAPSGVDA